MAKKHVVRLLVRLFGDPELQGKYRKNPDKLAKAAGLSRQERELLASGDEAAIRDYLGRAAGVTNVVKSGLAAGPNVVKSAIKAGGPNVVKSALTNVVKSGLTNVVKTSLTNVVKTAIRRPKTPKKPKK
jgi:hypothetical protein